MAENGGVTNFTPTAKTEGTWVIFFLPSFALYFPTRKSTRTPTRDLGFGREVAFCFGSALLGNFAPLGVLFFGFTSCARPKSGPRAGPAPPPPQSRLRARNLAAAWSLLAREVPRPTTASARRSEYDSAAAVVGSDRALALNGEMASSKVKSWVCVTPLCGALQRLY